MDRSFLDRVDTFDPDGLAEDIRKRKCEACGSAGLNVMLAARKMGAQRAKVLHYAKWAMSPARGAEGGRLHGAAAVYEEASGRKEKTENPRGAGTDLGYSREEKETLRELAYHAIRSRCLGEPMPEIPVGSQKLMEPRGAFVCIHKGADLRGCIGVIESRDPLGETIKKMAVEAAFGDPRFCALAPDEMDGSTSKYRPHPASGIRAFRHRGRNTALHTAGVSLRPALPQVAVEQGWDRTQFLEWTEEAGSQKHWKRGHRTFHIFGRYNLDRSAVETRRSIV